MDLIRLAQAIKWSRSYDYLNPGFGQHNAPEWLGRIFVIGSRPQGGRITAATSMFAAVSS